MMSSSTGNALKVTIFGQSHSESMGAVIDGLPAGIKLDLDVLKEFLHRRRAKGEYTTQRQESDEPIIISGLVNGFTCGAPLTLIITNNYFKSEDYQMVSQFPRPSHSDYAVLTKYGEHADLRGGGHLSGRLTAPLCGAGGICIQLLAKMGVSIGARLISVGRICDDSPTPITTKELESLYKKEWPVINDSIGESMKAEIALAKSESDSVGGAIECVVLGLKAGVGEPIFDGIESRLSAALFAIPAVKGVEFGSGFAAAGLRGSEHNDAYSVENGRVVTLTNRHGGILGGISTAMPIVFRVAIKPTPSIAKLQNTVNLVDMTEAQISVRGRHDPCIAPRAVPCVEAATAITLLDLILSENRMENG